VPPEVRHRVVAFPGGLRASFRWAGSGEGAAVFALTETGGPLTDLGTLIGPDADRRCRAELRVETPSGPWTVRLASTINDEPAGLLWDNEELLLVVYGFHGYAFGARTGELRWSHRSASPVVALLGSPRLPHAILQAEIETFALEPSGEVAWRVAHSDVVAGAELVGGQLVLTSFAGQVRALDPLTGRTAGSARPGGGSRE
jgi:outer membrane protein assembly factor BamB